MCKYASFIHGNNNHHLSSVFFLPFSVFTVFHLINLRQRANTTAKILCEDAPEEEMEEDSLEEAVKEAAEAAIK